MGGTKLALHPEVTDAQGSRGPTPRAALGSSPKVQFPGFLFVFSHRCVIQLQVNICVFLLTNACGPYLANQVLFMFLTP